MKKFWVVGEIDLDKKCYIISEMFATPEEALAWAAAVDDVEVSGSAVILEAITERKATFTVHFEPINA
jgi:hypothetical protein